MIQELKGSFYAEAVHDSHRGLDQDVTDGGRGRVGWLLAVSERFMRRRRAWKHGPMPLHQADILLTRARLFFRQAEYPWHENDDGTPREAKDDLAEALRRWRERG